MFISINSCDERSWDLSQAWPGHFIGVSNVADELLSAEAPSYHASKAGFTNYLRSLALALKPKGVHITNVRFGFVDTKMAKGDVKPFMMTVEKAVDHLERCIKKKPVCYTAWISIYFLTVIRVVVCDSIHDTSDRFDVGDLPAIGGIAPLDMFLM
jgi:NAD(P)-dependent dehydrogenase (short-subunit alcohol dehydrogenase family)